MLKEATDPAAQALLESERTRLKALIRHQLAEKAILAEADEGLGEAFDRQVSSLRHAGTLQCSSCNGAALMVVLAVDTLAFQERYKCSYRLPLEQHITVFDWRCRLQQPTMPMLMLFSLKVMTTILLRPHHNLKLA